MSAQLIVECMKKLVQVHRSFNELSEEKTALLTKGDISHLRSLLQKETVYLKQLQQLEQERYRLVRYFNNSKGLVTEGGTTLTGLLPYVSTKEKEELLSLQQNLKAEIEQLKKKNQLNQQLISDSLRFVNLSLDILQPQQDSGNYQRTAKDDEPFGRSLFDSKA